MVLLRVMKAESLDAVILATSQNPDCDPLEEIADRFGVCTIRGSETDVLSRYGTSIRMYRPDAVVRICADNPLVSPDEIDRLADFFLSGKFDYVVNNTPECGLPDGLGAEMVRSDILLEIEEKAYEQRHREHVTSYIVDYSEKYRIGSLPAPDSMWQPELKLDVDTIEDLVKMRRFCAGLPEKNAPHWTSQQIVETALKHPSFSNKI